MDISYIEGLVFTVASRKYLVYLRIGNLIDHM